jgi:hypothetical protein
MPKSELESKKIDLFFKKTNKVLRKLKGMTHLINFFLRNDLVCKELLLEIVVIKELMFIITV